MKMMMMYVIKGFEEKNLTASWCSFGNKRWVTLTKPAFRNIRVSIHDNGYNTMLSGSMITFLAQS